MRAVFPWPYPALWPNKRPHWSAKAKATRDYRQLAALTLRGATMGPVRIIWCPKPTGPFPDRDNAIAACKALQDGIADAMRVNDSKLTVSYAFGERCKNGAVIVEIGPQNVEPMP